MFTGLSHNPLIEMAARAKRLPHIVVLCVVLSMVLIVVWDATPLIEDLIFGGAENIPMGYYDNAGFMFLPYLLLLVFLWLWLRLYEKRPFWTVGLPRGGALKRLSTGLVAGFGMMALVVGIMALTGVVGDEFFSMRTVGSEAIGSVLIFFVAYLMQSGTEELIFRGWVLQTLAVRYTLVAGLAVNILLFALFHFPSTPFEALQLFLFGGFLSLYALHEGSLWGVCGWHAAWNWAQGNFFGLPVTGEESPGGTIFDLQTDGPDWLTGGELGPEGSIITTVVIVAACWYLYRALKRKYATQPAPGPSAVEAVSKP